MSLVKLIESVRFICQRLVMREGCGTSQLTDCLLLIRACGLLPAKHIHTVSLTTLSEESKLFYHRFIYFSLYIHESAFIVV